MGITNQRSRPARRAWIPLLTLTAAGLTVLAASATVGPSGFEGNDGNMVHSTGTDWDNVGLTSADKFVDGSGKTDDTIGSSKEDDLYPQIVTQSAPAKNDFTNVAVKTERVSGKDFLYEASIRASANGSANLNVELNKGTASPVLSPNGVTPTRVAGDRLITFDFTSGGTVATITSLTWATSGTCTVANDSPPCWTNQVSLNSSLAEGAANDGASGRTGPINASDNYVGTGALVTNTFQEMAINLTDSNILPAGTCTTFAYVQLKSRSSGSQGTFNSDLKDLVLRNKNVSNCGSIKIHKQDDAGTALGGVKFNLYNDFTPFGGSRSDTDTVVAPAKTCTTASTTDSSASPPTVAGECVISNVQFGHYWVVEDAATVPANHTAADDQAVNVTNDTPVSLTFVNARQPGSITITKQDDSAIPVPLGGVTFTVYVDTGTVGVSRGSDDTVVAGTCTTATSTNPAATPPTTKGQCTVTGVQLGEYWVVEGTPPSGYTAAADQHVSLTTGGQNVGVTFTDPRKHRVIVLVCHEGSNTLDSSSVKLGSTTASSLASVPTALATKGVTEADLCGVGGASFGGLVHGSVTDTVTIATH